MRHYFKTFTFCVCCCPTYNVLQGLSIGRFKNYQFLCSGQHSIKINKKSLPRAVTIANMMDKPKKWIAVAKTFKQCHLLFIVIKMVKSINSPLFAVVILMVNSILVNKPENLLLVFSDPLLRIRAWQKTTQSLKLGNLLRLFSL